MGTVPLAGTWFEGGAAFAVLVIAITIFGIGECLHGTVQAPLVADLANPRLLGRYMALSAWSWSVAFTLGPAAGGFGLEHAPQAFWLVAASICQGRRGRPAPRARAAARCSPDARAHACRAAFGVPSGTEMPTMEDPLSTHAHAAPDPAHATAAGLERGHGSA